MEKYFIKDLLTGEYLNDDSYEWSNFENGSLYEKIEDKYYSPSGEMTLPENCEWVLFDPKENCSHNFSDCNFAHYSGKDFTYCRKCGKTWETTKKEQNDFKY